MNGISNGAQHGQIFFDLHAERGSAIRERLDAMHAKLGLPILKADGYDPGSVADEAVLEEQALPEAMGVEFYASGCQESAVPERPTFAVQILTPASRSIRLCINVYWTRLTIRR